MATAFAPMFNLLGAGAKPDAQNTGNSGGFATLMGMIPNLSLPENGIADTANQITSGSGQALIPFDLALMLGLGGWVGSGAGEIANVNTGAEGVTIDAQLLVDGNKNDQIIYLKLSPETSTEISNMEALKSGDDPDEMVFPVRLRSVEQDGNTLIANASLQTATGKEISIRLKWDLAGSADSFQASNWNQAVNSSDNGNQAALQPREVLTRLLGELGVQQFTIENISETPGLPVNTELSGVKSMLQKNARPGTLKTAENSDPLKAGAGGDVESDSKLSLNRVLNPDGAREGGLKAPSEKMPFNNLDSENTQKPNQPASISDRPAVVSEIGTPTLSISEVDLSASETKTGSTTQTIRFYDLDNKLNQLKQNPGQKIQIQMIPARLGKMDLSIASHRGIITVKLMVNSMAAKTALESNLGQLESQLASAGIKVDNLQVTVNQSSRNESFAGYQNQHQSSGFFDQNRRQNQWRNRHYQNLAGNRNNPELDFDHVMVNFLA